MNQRRGNLSGQHPTCVHRIRLRGPYQACWERVDRAEGPAPADACRVRLPGNWRTLFGETAGSVRLSRRFGRPTNLGPNQSVWLVVPAAEGLRRVRVNERLEHVVAPPTSERDAAKEDVQLDVTAVLRANNTLELWLEFDPATSSTPGGLPEPIVLEIRGSAATDG